jgi:hypothetical protein
LPTAARGSPANYDERNCAIYPSRLDITEFWRILELAFAANTDDRLFLSKSRRPDGYFIRSVLKVKAAAASSVESQIARLE